ncbi:formyltetrahydrofolate deformylase [Neobacillus massiliamazoniensis]|uniref:Formyltetrahydrofolate deformylase n=1 Tax=Neobacillus massiliamazoniensis TaxID=1499688 RepID=A0A0U1NWE6_9BACI|nr:formyltetrahydrofolate deformylase [Neobacillus massiliamazoniensis]CRK82333.1 formyltetrahydrofolate deformylase [Neobacillus massiliamazoniensis]
MYQEEVKKSERVRILISCQDQPGIVAAVSQLLFQNGGNIVQSDQHTTDPIGGMFFMRIEADIQDFELHKQKIAQDFQQLSERLNINWRMEQASKKKRLAIFVSKEDHCLLELLWQQKAGHLDAEFAIVVSNHRDIQGIVEEMGIPFHYVPVNSSNKKEMESLQIELIQKNNVDIIVLARYMQILSPEFTKTFPNQIINIHHSFLPAFIGANPYARAYYRGVKLIGATAHYVTDELDEGPIIEQDVQRVNHRDQLEDLKKIGKYIERTVLAQAVKWHVEDRVLTYGNKTIVFS